MRSILKGCGIMLLAVTMLFVFLVMGFVINQKSKYKQGWEEYRPYIIQESALYIYNNYEGVEQLEYSNFSISSYGLGSHNYYVDILVNGKYDYRLGMLWDRDVYEPGAIWAHARSDSGLPKKNQSTSVTQLPDAVILIDNTITEAQ